MLTKITNLLNRSRCSVWENFSELALLSELNSIITSDKNIPQLMFHSKLYSWYKFRVSSLCEVYKGLLQEKHVTASVPNTLSAVIAFEVFILTSVKVFLQTLRKNLNLALYHNITRCLIDETMITGMIKDTWTDKNKCYLSKNKRPPIIIWWFFLHRYKSLNNFMSK